MRAFDESGNVGHDKAAVLTQWDNPEIRFQGGEIDFYRYQVSGYWSMATCSWPTGHMMLDTESLNAEPLILELRNRHLNTNTLLEVNDLSAAVLVGNGQTRFATGEGFGNFIKHFLGGVIGFA